MASIPIRQSDRWTEATTFDFNILQNLTTSLNGMASGRRFPYAQAFWALWSRPSLCKACSTRRSFSCLPEQRLFTQLTADPRPSAPLEFDPADEPPPYPPPCHPSPSPFIRLTAGSASPDAPLTLPHLPDSPSPSFPAATRSPYQHPSPCAISLSDMSQREVRVIF